MKTDARETIARAIEPFVHHADDVTSVVANTLTAAGYRILGPGELDAETIEKCAAELEKPHKFIDGTEMALPSALACAAAIRALGRKV